ncbi:MAG: tyrosine-type recombinase/integrase [Ferruginibacter sp.]|nr:tyrosine-type recombinase/integrase [Ferruginibacter sp.]
MARFNNTSPMDFFELYHRFIKDSLTGKRLQVNGKRISAGTIASYSGTLQLLKKFSEEKQFQLRIKPVKSLTKRELVTEKNYWNKFYKRFTDYLYHDCNHFDNYVGLNIKNIRTFFGYLQKTLLIDAGGFHKQLYVRKEEIPIITLLPEELNFFIYNKPYEQSLNSTLRKAKDVFVFGCTVALRFSDLSALRNVNLRKMNDNWYLFTRSKKTAVETQVRLPDYAVEIADKYKKQRGGYLLPRFNIVNLNKYIKRLTEAAGFVQPVPKTRGRRGTIKEIHKTAGDKKSTYRFCDLVSTHTMRRTAITTMLSLGMPEHIVRKISGHSPMSKEFFRYVALAQSYQDKETSQMFEKLKAKVM